MYEEEGESERSQQWGPQIGGKCERDFIGYSNSYNGNSNRRQQQLKASAQGLYGEVRCSRDSELQGGFGREDSFFCKEDSLSEGYGSVTLDRISLRNTRTTFSAWRLGGSVFVSSTKHSFHQHQYQGEGG